MEHHFNALARHKANYIPLSPLSFLSRAAHIHGEKLAIISGTVRRNWRDMASRVRTIAANLTALNVGKGDTVSILSANRPELFELHFALPLSGAVMNTLNTRLEPETIAYILDHANTKVIIVEEQFLPLLQKAFDQMGETRTLFVISDSPPPLTKEGQDIHHYEKLLELTDLNKHELIDQLDDEWRAIALNYTSGTSGRPKGVVYHHRGAYLMALGTVAAWQIPPSPVYLSVVPMFHCNGWGHPWVMALVGGTMVFIETPSPDHVFAALDSEPVTHFGAAPVVLQMLAESENGPRKKFDPPIKVMTAGAPPPPSVLEKAALMGFDVTQVYGLTETYGHISQCLWQPEWNDLSSEDQAKHQAMQGIAFPMVESVKVFDRCTGEEVPHDGETQGEIAIRGNTVMKGYYKDETTTNEAFKDGWFWSGDAAVVHENGYMQIRDRLKDVIISGGENISSVEVEAVLYRHPAVQAAAVVAKPDPKWGEVPCAFIELREGTKVDSADIITFCREHLAGFKTPKHVIFSTLPKTSTGKIQKFELRKRVKE